MFNQLHVYASPQFVKQKYIKKADIQIREVSKLSEKLKWMDRFCKGYSGATGKVLPELVEKSRVFLAIYNGKEAGYIRIGNYAKIFSNVCNEDVWGINEGYVKPAYRSNGVMTALRSYVVQNHEVKVMRIETRRFNSLSEYYRKQGFVYGYSIENGTLTAICVPEFLNTLLAFAKYKSKH